MRIVGSCVWAALTFATVELWFLEIARRFVSPSVFVETPRLFSIAVVLTYVLGGVVAGIALLAVRHAGRWTPPALVAIACVTQALLNIHRSVVPIIVVGLGIAVLAWARLFDRVRGRIAFLLSPWTVSVLLVGPDWLANDYLVHSRYLIRALAFALSVVLVMLVAYVLSKALTARIARPAALATILLTIGGALLLQRPAEARLPPPANDAPSGAPNILLIVLDTVRADHLSVYGYSRRTTPALERFATSAALYRRAVAPSNMTLATHASLFTGLYPTEHGAHPRDNDHIGTPLPPQIPTLAQLFRRRGYDVSSVAANIGYLGRDFGLDRGFANLYAELPPRTSASIDASSFYPNRAPLANVSVQKKHLLRYASWRMLRRLFPPFAYNGHTTPANDITRLALERIDEAAALQRPFFLFLNYLDAHGPYLPPPPYDSLYPGRSSVIERQVRDGKVVSVWPSFFPSPSITPDVRDDLVARYDGAISFIDGELGTLFAAMQRRGVFENTIVVVTSDHGEAFGEHDTLGHGSSLFDEQVRVPLIIRTPGQPATVIDDPVSTVDVFSFLESSGANSIRPKLDAVAEGYPFGQGNHWRTKYNGRAIVRGRYKLVRYERLKRETLFDIEADPRETRDVRSEHPDVYGRLSAALDRWIEEHPPKFDPQPHVRGEALKRLRALGYIR